MKFNMLKWIYTQRDIKIKQTLIIWNKLIQWIAIQKSTQILNSEKKYGNLQKKKNHHRCE